MVMPSTVNHVQSELSRVLKRVLDSPKLMAELLKEENPETAAAFINTYTNVYKGDKKIKDGKEIPVMTNYPQSLEANKTMIFVGNGKGHEENTSIGQHEGDINFNSDGITTERIQVKIVDGKATFSTKSNIGELLNIVELGISANHTTIKDNTITLELFPRELRELGISEDQLYTIKYERSLGDKFGIASGFTAYESVNVVIISENLDTLRLLDLVVKAVVIILRSSKEEQSIYQMDTISYSPVVPTDDIPNVESAIFTREVEINYRVSYGVDSIVTDFLETVDFTNTVI